MNPIDLYVSYLCDSLEKELKSDDFTLDTFLANNNLTINGLFIQHNEKLAKIILSADKICLCNINEFTNDIERYYVFVIYDNLIENKIDVNYKNVNDYLSVDLPKKEFLIKINKLKSLFDKFINYCRMGHTFLSTAHFSKYFDVLFYYGTFEEKLIIMHYIKYHIDIHYRTVKYIEYLKVYNSISVLDNLFGQIVEFEDMKLLIQGINIFKYYNQPIVIYQNNTTNINTIKMFWLLRQNISQESELVCKLKDSDKIRKKINDVIRSDIINTFFLKLDPQQRFAKKGTEMNTELLDNRPIIMIISEFL